MKMAPGLDFMGKNGLGYGGKVSEIAPCDVALALRNGWVALPQDPPGPSHEERLAAVERRVAALESAKSQD